MAHSSDWRRVTKSDPCPICEKDHACKVSADGAVAMCKRIELGAFKESRGWYFHRIRHQPQRNGSAHSYGHNGKAKVQGKTAKAYPDPLAAIEAIGRMIGGRFVENWIYCTTDGGDAFQVARYAMVDGEKQYRPIHLAPDGWRMGDPPGLLPLYRLDELPVEGTLWVTEGEKAADAAVGIGLAATTSAHGAGAAEKTDWTPLAGRRVCILPDADEPGHKYAQDVARLLMNLDPPARVTVVDLPGLPEKGDIVEYLNARTNQPPRSLRAEFQRMAAEATELPPAELIGGPVLTRLSDVAPQPVEWLWPQRIAIGKLNLVFGDPGKGKSFITLDMAARVSKGGSWADGSGLAPKGTAIMLNCEDGLADTIRPRLDRAGADVSKIIALEGIRKPGQGGKMLERSFTLADLPDLERAVKQNPDTRLIVIDPVSAYLEGSDSHNNAEIRGLLAPLAKMANDYRVAVVMVTHMSKSTGGRAMYRAMGSLAFIAAARSAWVVVEDKNNPQRRLFLPAKNNIGNDQSGLAYSIVDGAVAWESEPVTTNVDEALAAQQEEERRPGPQPRQRNGAAEWLTELLAPGAMRVGDYKKPDPGTIANAVKEAGLSWGTVRRAREALGIKPYKGQFGDGWYWKLPPMQDVQVTEAAPGQSTCTPSNEPAHLRLIQPTTAAVGLPDAPGFRGGAHLGNGASNDKSLWNGNGEGAHDPMDPWGG